MISTGFFRVCFPYGVEKRSDGSWIPFNREYCPLGWMMPLSSISPADNSCLNLQNSLKFKGLKDDLIQKTFSNDLLITGSQGEILKVYFYSDRTNPSEFPEFWSLYIKHISFFSKFELLYS
jgi:hypothetical protein